MTLDLAPMHRPISAQFLFRAYRACQLLGARRPILLRAMELEEPALRNPLTYFDSTKLSALIAASAEELNISNLIFKIAEKMVPSGFSDPGFLAMFRANLGIVLRNITRSQRLGEDRPVFDLSRDRLGDYVVWDDAVCSSRQIKTLGIAVIIASLRTIELDPSLDIRSVSFTHSKSEEGGFVTSFMNCDSASIPIFYDRPHNRIEFRRGFFDLSNPGSNERLRLTSNAQRSQKRWRNRPYAKSCYDYLIYLLDKPGPNLDSAAETFAMAERTLRRKLVSERTSFREILETVRRDVCQLYFLEGKRPLSDISTLLGYSELSAFTRAYTGWYGNPPSKDASAHAKMAA